MTQHRKTFFQWASAFVGLSSSILLAAGSLGSSAASIAGIASPKWDYSPELARSLAEQTADGTVGFFLLTISFAMAIPGLIPDARTETQDADLRLARAFGVIVGVSLLAVGCFISGIYADNITAASAAMAASPAGTATPPK